MQSTSEPRFNTSSLLGVFDNRWTLTGGAFINEANALFLPYNASATITLTSEVDFEFEFAKIINRFSINMTSGSNVGTLNFNSGPTIRMQEFYKDTDGNVAYQRCRILGFNTKVPDGEKYIDTSVLPMQNRKMSKMTFSLVNDNPDVNSVVIYSLGFFTSIDVSESQVSSVTNSFLSKQSASAFKMYRDETTGSIKGIGVFIDSSSNEIKLRPNFFNGMLVSISTNYGQDITVINTTEDIDLNT